MPASRPRITFGQFSEWPEKQTAARTNAQFKGKQGRIDLDRNIRDLEYELGRIKVDAAQIILGLDGRYFRRDGWPMSKADGHPGVILAYSHPKFGQMRIMTDQFFSWVDNLRGIVLTLEGLRMMERYGTTGNGKQYEGFRQLPASTGATMDVHEAAEIVREASGLNMTAPRIVEIRELAEIATRSAIFKSHPDRRPKDAPAAEWEEAYHKVERARQALVAHHGGTL